MSPQMFDAIPFQLVDQLQNGRAQNLAGRNKGLNVAILGVVP
jgi:hypothetical protein